MIRVNVTALSKIANRLSHTANEVLQGLAGETAEHMYREVVPRTPVDTGHLRANWETVVTDDLNAIVKNEVHYASFVEFGRRNRFGGRFVPGQKFMTTAKEDTIEALPQIVGRRLKQFLRGGTR